MVTGESLPVEKGPGDPVTGGTVNLTGAFRFEATRVGSETVLAQIIRLVQEAQGSKAPIQRLADRIAAIFVPIVIGLAVLTFLLWLWRGPDFTHAITRGRGRPHHRVPLRLGSCHADLAAGRHRQGRRTRDSHSQRGIPRGRRRDRFDGARQDRHHHAGPARGDRRDSGGGRDARGASPARRLRRAAIRASRRPGRRSSRGRRTHHTCPRFRFSRAIRVSVSRGK